MLDADRAPETFPGFAGSAVRFLNDSRRTGDPLTIGINGRFPLAIRDETSFRMLLDLVDRLEGLDAVRLGLKELDEGKGIGLEQARERFREK